MSTFKLSIRPMIYGLLLGTVYLGLDAPAMAHEQPLWVRQIGTSLSEYALGVATDPAGNAYVTGTTGGSLGGPNRGSWDAWLAKVDAAGRVLWKRQLGSASYDVGFGVATDPADNVYVTGLTTGSLGGPNRGDFDAWVAKVNAAGKVLWKRQLGTESDDRAFGVATDAACNVYLAGETYGPLAGSNRGGPDAWVAKVDATGRVSWKRQLGTELVDSALDVATDFRGNAYLVGETYGSLGGPNAGGFDAFVVKFDSAGRMRWKRQLGTEENDVASGVATDTFGNIYMAGATLGSLGGPNPTIGVQDAWLAKVDTAGRLLWRRQIGTDASDSAQDVATDAAGNVYVTGWTFGSLGGPNPIIGVQDAWLAKVDAAGKLLWKRQLGTGATEESGGVAADAGGNVFITGSTDGALSGPNHGADDAWVAKYSTRR